MQMRALLLVILLASPAFAGSAWVALAPVITPRQEIAVAAANGRVYIFGGISAQRTILTTVEEYDPATNRWSFVAPLPAPLHHAAAATVGDAIYIIGGYATLAFTPVSTVFRYDTRTDSWTRVADLPRARGALAAATIDGKIYAVGGVPGTRELTVYDPATDRWSDLPSMPTGREHLAAAAVGGKLYVAGGRLAGNTSAFESFDPVTATWTALPPLPTARSGLAAAAVGDRIYVFGGEGNRATPTGVFAEAEVYDVATNTWSRELDMALPRHGIGAAAIGSRIYIPAGSPLEGFGTTSAHDMLVTGLPRRRAVAK